MSKYILRLDDASDYMDLKKWGKIEELLDKYEIKPLVGIIPDNEDPSLIEKYSKNEQFWEKVDDWKAKNWALALHGCNHKYVTKEGGINPVNARSEFAGVSLEKQCEKIKHGITVLREHDIEPKVFFAPSHTFDENTLLALKKESNIRIISDTIANDRYTQDGMTFVPQQSGKGRRLPFKLVTFCYHPNMMKEEDFFELEKFLKKNQKKFVDFPLDFCKRRINIVDRILRALYFLRRK